MARLTDGRSGNIAAAEPPEKGQRLIFDEHRDAPRGFALRITAAGGKAFILRYRIDGREHRATIGAWPTWPLERAREEARRLLLEIERGNDPLAEKRRRKDEPTVAELAEEWLEKYATGLARERDIRGHMNTTIIPAIGNVKVSAVRRRHVIELVERKAATAPRAAGHVLIYARRLFDYAADRDLIPANPVAGLKPSSITVRGKRDPLAPKARGRILDPDEIRGFWQNVEASGMSRLTAIALKLVLVTGQRPGECAGMTEDEIDGRLWTIPASRRGKTDTEHTVHLTDSALSLIDAARAERDRLARRRTDPPAQFIFEARPGAAVTNGALARAVRRTQGELLNKPHPQWGHWRPHDLRRTMRSGLSACRIRPDVAELVIGHTKKGIVATYDLHGYEAERRAALEAWEVRLRAILDGRDPDAESDNVVRLEEVRR